MGETEIGWTHRPGTIGRTWNPTRGCFPVSPGCANCYACRQGARFSGPGKPFDGFVKLTRGGPPKWTGKGSVLEEKLTEPLSWREPSTVFVNSMSDLFFEEFSFEHISAVFAIMALTPRHTYQILTKRPERALEFFAWLGRGVDDDHRHKLNDAFGRYVWSLRTDRYWIQTLGLDPYNPVFEFEDKDPVWPLPNVWIGVSAEDQQRYDERLPALIQIPAAVKFLSLEPLLGPIELDLGMCHVCMGTEYHSESIPDRPGYCTQPMCPECDVEISHYWWNRTDDCSDATGVSWVIIGAESGPGARHCETEWIRGLVKQCQDGHVATFLKQAVIASERNDADLSHPRHVITAGDGSAYHGKGAGGPMITAPYLDGKQYIEFPTIEQEDAEDAA